MSEDNKNKDWYLYVLRYNSTGNYYVGTTPDLAKRMLIHWRQTSLNSDLPIWSERNKSTLGFLCYWFNFDGKGLSQGKAEKCEAALCKLLVDKIRSEKTQRDCRCIYVSNGRKGYDKNSEFDIKFDYTNPESSIIDDEISKFLKSISLLDLPPENTEHYKIKCHKAYNIGEYNPEDCNNEWDKVASTTYNICAHRR